MDYQKTKCEIQSGLDRVKQAENLILQLDNNHEGRNTWLLNYGTGPTARAIRAGGRHPWVRATQSAATRDAQ